MSAGPAIAHAEHHVEKRAPLVARTVHDPGLQPVSLDRLWWTGGVDGWGWFAGEWAGNSRPVGTGGSFRS
jgi:hypothetical protein